MIVRCRRERRLILGPLVKLLDDDVVNVKAVRSIPPMRVRARARALGVECARARKFEPANGRAPGGAGNPTF